MSKSIQMNLFDYFKDSGTFTIEEANKCVLEHYKKDVKIPSIRARIYEGIDKGLFKKVSRGVYIAESKDNSCLLVNGDGRDLSMIRDNSIDAIICDHPYKLSESHKGGNRNLADYDTFRYTEEDFKEKYRVLKEGGFLVEMLPERNEKNMKYISDILRMAEEFNDNPKNRFHFYAVVPWKKGDFVINQGRKSKNTEDIYFFTKGKARNLRLDNKKNLALAKEHNIHLEKTDSNYVADELIKNGIGVCYMSGTNGMLPTVFDYQSPSKKERIHQAEKPVDLYSDIINYITEENELVLDPYGGSGNAGKAALKNNRDCIVIEKDEKTFHKMIESFDQKERYILKEYEDNENVFEDEYYDDFTL